MNAVTSALLHFLWQGAVLAALLACGLALTRSARVRYSLAVAALSALPLAFAVTWILCLQPAARISLPARLSFGPIAALPSAGSPAIPMPTRDRLAWLVPLWMAGVLVCYARSLTAWFAAQRLRRRGVCAAPEFWQHRLRHLAARLRVSRPVLLLESCLTEVPVTFGWFRPVILLPIGFFAGLPADQVEAILLHELAHIRRFDYAVNLLSTFVEGLLFYHPAVWWISRVVRAERENCCDDAVVAQSADPRSYAAALARLEHNRSLAAEAFLAANGGNLMKRIRRLLDQPERPRPLAAPAVAGGLVLLTVAAALAWTPQSHRQLLTTQTLLNTYGSLPVAHKEYLDFLAFLPQVAAPQNAEALTGPYRKWLTEDVVYIITAEERAAYRALTTDADREHFIEQFWLRRDPTPGTPQNEYKQEHYRRIAYANQHFSTSTVPGWKTDRGRIYIIYGPPDEIEDHRNEAARPPFQQWRYRLIEGMGQNVIIQFTDTKRDGSFPMDSDPAQRQHFQPMDPMIAAGKGNSQSLRYSSGSSPRLAVALGRDGLVAFQVSSDLAAAAYTGTWQLLAHGTGAVLQSGTFDSRLPAQTVTLQSGDYALKLDLHDPNGKPFTASVGFKIPAVQH